MAKETGLAIQYHPKRGTIVAANFDQGFRKPEMVKRRLCVVLSPPIRNRAGLCTVVPLSTTAPDPVMAYHYELDIPFQLPKYWGRNIGGTGPDGSRRIWSVRWGFIALICFLWERIGTADDNTRCKHFRGFI